MTTYTLRTELRPHQRPPVEQFARLRVGALFMDPGTGKTRTAIEILARRQHRVSKVVWLAPVNARRTIDQQWQEHTSLSAGDIHMFDDGTAPGKIPDAAVHIIGSESLSNSRRVVLAAHALVGPDVALIIDESDMFRTPWAARSNWAEQLARQCGHRFILTGTPSSEGLPDLYQQMRLLDPAILGYSSWYQFSRNHLVYSEKYPGKIETVLNTENISRRIAPFVYQFSKSDLATLPPKLYDAHWYDLTDEQEHAYQRAKNDFLEVEMGEGADLLDVRRLFTALQTIAAGYWNRRDPSTGEVVSITFSHGRLDALEMVLEQLPAGDQVVVWCKYRRSAAQIVERLRARGGVAEYHGGVPERQRAAQLASFASKRAQFLVGTASTGGRGLNELVGARWAVFYETSFKARERVQAEDRLHRLTTTQSVTMWDVIANCKIERLIHQALRRKEDVSAAFLRELRAARVAGKREATIQAL